MSYIAAASRSTLRASYHSNVSSPTNSKATHKTHWEMLLETEVTNLRNEFAQFKATQAEGTVSSRSSGKSTREQELETQVQHLTAMVNQQTQTLTHQAAMITDLKMSLHTLLSQFQPKGSHLTGSTPPLRKRKDIPAVQTHIDSRPSKGTNNAGEDTDMSAPPDPHSANHDVNTSFDSVHMSDNIDTSFYDEESLQESHAPHTYTSPTGPAHATQSKSDMKKEC